MRSRARLLWALSAGIVVVMVIVGAIATQSAWMGGTLEAPPLARIPGPPEQIVDTSALGATTPSLLVAPFDQAHIAQQRTAWAVHLRTGPEVTVKSINMEMILVPAGQFAMGSPETPAQLKRAFPYAQAKWLTGERPVHRVTISRPFYMAKCEVTNQQFRKFVEETHHKTEAETNGIGGSGFTGKPNQPWERRRNFNWQYCGMEQRDTFPVVNVSWHDATEFCKWLSSKEGLTFRLPTEAEYEYACRAGTTSRYYNGNNPEELTKIANVWDVTSKRLISSAQNTLASSDGWPFAAPVGQYAPNNFGLYDMLGNANEWCLDWFDETYYAKSPDKDPIGPPSGKARVIRGGGWGLFALSCRCADRHFEAPGFCDGDLGFRVICVR